MSLVSTNAVFSLLEGTKTIIKEGINNGEIRNVNPDEAVYSIMALIEGMVIVSQYRLSSVVTPNPKTDV